MRKTFRLMLLLAVVCCMAACTEDRDGTPAAGRDITYTVESKVNHASLKSEAEWDELLDRFCTFSAEGMTVTFYNAAFHGTATATAKGIAGLSGGEPATISTDSREELKTWMKAMEKAGKTVTVTYDDTTGRWNGTAYLNGPQLRDEDPQTGKYSGVLVLVEISDDERGRAVVWALKVSDDSLLVIDNGGFIPPSQNMMVRDGEVYAIGDEATLSGTVTVEDGIMVLHLAALEMADVAGRWHYYSMTKLFISSEENFINSYFATYTPEGMGTSIYYDLREDGTMTFTRTSLYSEASSTAEGTWSVTPGGEVVCDFFDGGSHWTVDCIVNGLMVLSSLDLGTEEGDFYYQMELHRMDAAE
ncbi:MAG: hypothetical protein IJ745_01585 [Bacteroidales bacterium]|nr:hypothetical protein [Bacteroidales bacterium]